MIGSVTGRTLTEMGSVQGHVVVTSHSRHGALVASRQLSERQGLRPTRPFSPMSRAGLTTVLTPEASTNFCNVVGVMLTTIR